MSIEVLRVYVAQDVRRRVYEAVTARQASSERILWIGTSCRPISCPFQNFLVRHLDASPIHTRAIRSVSNELTVDAR